MAENGALRENVVADEQGEAGEISMSGSGGSDNGAQDLILQAAMCELLALSLRYPSPELAGVVVSGEWADAAEEIASALGLDLPEEFDGEARNFAEAFSGNSDNAEGVEGADCPESAGNAAGAEAALHALRAEATRLFVGAPDPVVSPYEGIWRAGDDGVQALLFVNPHSMAVERFCKSCGLGRPEGTNEPLDHVATELELLQYLASLAAGISSPATEGFRLADLPGGSPVAASDQFLKEHALEWMPRFADAVASETRLPYFRAAATLLKAFLESNL